MAEKKAGRVRLSGRFTPGTSVYLIPRSGDWFSDTFVRQATQTAKVGKDNEVAFHNLDPGSQWWIAGEVDGRIRHAAATAKESPDAKPKGGGSPLAPGYIGQGLDRPNRGVTTGARSTQDAKLVEAVRKESAIPSAHEPTPASERPDEPQPHPKQADVKGAQRSDTPMGEAHPVEAGEPQPKVRQDQIKAGTPQRSATPLGEATPKPVDEQVPGARQEDTTGVRQRSDTPHGTAEPKPATKNPTEQAKAKDSAESKAKGATAPKAGTAKRKTSRAKGRSKAAAPVKKGAGDKGKAARKGGADSAPDPNKATTEKRPAGRK